MKPDKGQVIIIKKKGRAVHAHHGGAWKVAYADFVTAMMALFIVLWLLSQTDQAMRERLSNYFRTGVFSGAPSVLNGGSGLQIHGYLEPQTQAQIDLDQASLERAGAQIRAQLAQLVAADPAAKELPKHVDVRMVEQGLLIQVVDGGGKDVLFDLSSAELKPALIELLNRLGPILAKIDNQLQVHGHTDARPFPSGSGRSNWELSFQRADRARVVLEKSGVRPGQISGVFAHGDSAPISSDRLAPENRRLAILAVRKGYESSASRGVPARPL